MNSLTILWAIFLLPLPATAILRLKLQRWFPDDSDYWINAASKCEAEISAYLINNRTDVCPTPCSCAADCILNDIPGTLESNYASAQVVLGLIPAVLLLISPRIAEVAVVSTRRPLLAVLIALGCPTSYLVRVFRRVDIGEPLMPTDRSIIGTMLGEYLTKRYSVNATAVGDSGIIKRCHRRVTVHVVDLAMYALALLAIANGVQISIYTDLRTISGWRCGALFMPMVWFLLSIVEHGWGMIAARVQRWPDRQNAGAIGTEPVNARTSPSGSHISVPNLDSQSQTTPQSHIKLCDTQQPFPWLRSLLVSDLYTQLLKAKPTLWSESIFWIAQASALVHMIFGIFELSSLVFISALESVQVFARFALSIVLCQVVVQIELAVIGAELQNLGAYAVAASVRAPSSAIPVSESQTGSREQVLLSDLSGSIRSQRSGENRGHSVQAAGCSALVDENMSAR